MNKNQLLDMMGSIRDKYVLEAIESRGSAASRPKSHLRLHRIGLLAAVLAALLLLAGCVAVYLRLQDMSIGKDTYVQAFDEKGKAIVPTEKTRNVINFAGIAGSPEQKASAQWLAFTESLEKSYLLNAPEDPDIPQNCEYIYGCYTREMADKLEEIARANQVALLEDEAVIQLYQSDIALEALGKTSLLREDAAAAMGPASGVLYAPYNFSLQYDLTLTGGDAKWPGRVYVRELYQHSGYLPAQGGWYLDLENFQQWNHTTSQGVPLLIAMDKIGRSFLICQQEDGILTVSIDANQTGSRYPDANQLPGKEAIEQFAEVFDFSLAPKAIDISALQPKLDAAEAEYQAAHTYDPETYGSYGDYILQRGYSWMPGNQYVFYDLDGDGEEELLLGQDGWCENYLTMKDGEVEHNWYFRFRPCQDGGKVFYDRSSFSQWRTYWYAPPQESAAKESNTFIGVVYRDGQWWKFDEMRSAYKEELQQAITQEEADAIRAQHPAIELDWQDIKSFPLDEKGTTIGSYLQSLDARPSSEELRKAYGDYVRERMANGDSYTHYRMLDINGDGIEDLLLSGDGKMFWEFQVYRYGQMAYSWPMDLYLCEDGVLEDCPILRESADDGEIEIEEHVFYKFHGDFELEVLAYAAYNKATASWQSDRDGTPMDAAEAEAILARYPRIDQGMRPISELIG